MSNWLEEFKITEKELDETIEAAVDDLIDKIRSLKFKTKPRQQYRGYDYYKELQIPGEVDTIKEEKLDDIYEVFFNSCIDCFVNRIKYDLKNEIMSQIKGDLEEMDTVNRIITIYRQLKEAQKNLNETINDEKLCLK